MCARPAQHRRRLRVLDIEHAGRLALGEQVADRAKHEGMGRTVAGGHVAGVLKQDLVQVVALVVTVEDHLDARVELAWPVPGQVGRGADALGELDRELVLHGGEQFVLGAEVQVEQPLGDPGAAGDVVKRSGRDALGNEQLLARRQQVGAPLFGGFSPGHHRLLSVCWHCPRWRCYCLRLPSLLTDYQSFY